MKKLISLILVLMVIFCSNVLASQNNSYVHEYKHGTHYLAAAVQNLQPDYAGVVFVWDEFSEKAWIILVVEKPLKVGVDDYILKFGGDLNQAFPMERIETGDPNTELLCQVEKKDLLQFLYELTHTNPRLLKVSLNSEIDETRSWCMETDRIPEYINH